MKASSSTFTRSKLLAALLVLACTFLASALLGVDDASSRRAILGAEGEILRVVEGSYGQLFPRGKATKANYPVLALDLLYVDRKVRIPIPGTLGREIESSPSLIYEQSSDTVYIVWASRFNFVHTRINLISFTAGKRWSSVIEVSGDPFSLKNSPNLAVTREVTTSPDDPSVTLQQTVIHTLWWEETGGGNHVVYAPLLLENGRYLGQNSVVRLTGFSTQASPTQASLDLERSPAVTTSGDGHSAFASYIDPVTGRFVTLKLTLAPDDLTRVADAVEGDLSKRAAELCAQGGNPALANAAFESVMKAGSDSFHVGVLSYLAHELRAEILKDGCASGPRRLGKDARSHIVLVGIKAGSEDLLRLRSGARSHIVLVGVKSGPDSERTAGIERLADRNAPVIGDGPTRIFVSRNGKSGTVAWQPNARKVLYRESTASGWSEVFTLLLDDELNAAEAYQALEKRVRDR